ncbi:MAG: M1 family metallopeptidase, partial [Planctomycetota bacterium]
PQVRSTYTARLRVPAELLALMSASNPQTRTADGVYEFEMPQPIPSYLMAIAVGDLKFESLSDRCGVYAEPSVLKKAAWEFAPTEQMMVAAETLYGPYRWGRYDILVLPPSFPFGGMENPRLTFATPTVIAGDRSLVSLIAHELAHSWSGNLVTAATWNEFWLNEGFTVYFEHRIMERLYGRGYDEMLARLGMESLIAEMKELDARDTHLQLDLAGRHPDDGLTGVAYEKGYLFLRMIEEAVGRERFDAFLRDYFEEYAFRSMTTDGFLDFLSTRLLDQRPGLSAQLQLAQWIHGAGLPANCPEIQLVELLRAQQAAETFARSGTVPATEAWTTHHWLHFLRSLPDPVSRTQLATLDEKFQFSQSGNAEILHDWLLLSIRAEYEPAMKSLEQFLTSQGRCKFLTPLYAALMETDRGRQRAKQIFEQARERYHPLAVTYVEAILNEESP